jgi:hypothetical protein
MKAKGIHHRKIGSRVSNEQVRVEIQAFLRALDSYPAIFAVNPEISFEEHRARLMNLRRAIFLAANRHQSRKN